jgi:hypothetical protein
MTTETPGLPTTREISRLVSYYNKNIRLHSKNEQVGIFRQIMLMVKKGTVTMSDISQAMQNYAADEWVKSCHQTQRHHIRKFMMAEKIQQWLQPKPSKPVDAALGRLEALAQSGLQPKTVQEASAPIYYDDPEGTDTL